MSSVYLILAGCFAIAWPVASLAQGVEQRPFGVVLAVGGMALSGFLWLQKEIALGTAYAVWTGIGAAGTFLIGIWFFGDATTLGRYLGLILIVSGVVVLKLAH
jgi:quaternary ammonium compound-resistance protein SugE